MTLILIGGFVPNPYANAGLFDAIGGFFEDLGGAIVDDTGWIEDTGEVIANETVKIVKVSVSETGQFIDDVGNVIDDVSAAIYIDELFEVSPVTGMPILKVPTETTDDIKSALLTGDWNTVALGLKDDAVHIGVRAGATASEIEAGLEDFGEDIGGAFEDAGEFIIDSEAIKQLGKGFDIIRGALTECLGSVEAVEYCYEQFVGQLIEFYDMMRAYVVKVTELKGFAKGAVFDEVLDMINKIEKKSVKYFMPVLANSEASLDFGNMGSPFAEGGDVHEHFEQFASIQGIRDSLTSTEYSYHTSPAIACGRVAIPIVCDYYEELDNHTINRFDYTDSNLSASESSERQQLFHALNIKAFGATYRNASNGNRSDAEEAIISDYLQTELYSDINWNDDQRIPYIVENELLQGAGGAFIATDTDAIILLNEQLFADDESLAQGFSDDDVMFAQGVALEEIGHWLNWRRCQYDSAMMGCANVGGTFGDPGLKFSEASFIEFTDFADYISQLSGVSEGVWSHPVQLSLVGGDTAVYEGNPSLLDLQDAVASVKSKFRFRMRLKATDEEKVAELNDLAKAGSSIVVEVNYTPPKRVKAGELDEMEKYGFTNADQTLYLAEIDIRMSLENFIGTDIKGDVVFFNISSLSMPVGWGIKQNFKLSLKSNFGITFPLLKESMSGSGFTNVNEDFRDDNIRMFYDIAPQIKHYNNFFLYKLGALGVQLDQINSVWAGVKTSWPANTASIPIAITMAGITVASSGVGCVKGVVAFSSMGLPISQTSQCILGAQLASGTVVSGAGALFSLFDPNITFAPGSGWKHGIRLKVENDFGNIKAGGEVRFELTNKKWDMAFDR